MASINKRGVSWVADIRRAGFPSKSKSFPTKAAAVKWARETEAALYEMKNDKSILSELPLGHLIEKYMEEVGGTKPFGTTKESVLNMLDTGLGHVAISKLTSTRIMQYVSKRMDDGAGGVTVAIDLTYLKGVLDTALHLWGINTDSSTVTDVKAKLKYLGINTRSKSRDRRPTEAELQRITEHISKMPTAQTELPYNDLIQFAIASSMRAGEITRIRWADVNVANRTVIIRDRKDPKEKVGNHQIVPLLGAAFDIAMRQPKTKDPRIFPFKVGTMTSVFPRMCTTLGIVDLRFHDFRHEGISRLFEQGYQIHEVAIVSGHKSWDMLKRYTQLKPESLHRD